MTIPHERSSATRAGLPNLIIIGAMKAGTTSLHAYLGQHPDIAMSRPKELDFFLERSANRTLAWYASHFDAEARIRGEASPSYSKFPYHRGVPARMHALLPEARLVYIVRDPIERTVSQYQHEFLRNREARSLTEALADEANNPYIDQSCYAMQLEQYLAYYPGSQILVVTTEDLRDDSAATLDTITTFLELPSFEFSVEEASNVADRRGRPRGVGRLADSSLAKRLATSLPDGLVRLGKRLRHEFSDEVRRPVLDDRQRERLSRVFHPDVERFRGLTGYRFDKWSV
jgi:hypothetical protein